MQNRLIAIRLSSMGDVAMLIPVFLSFHRVFPEINIVLITRKQYAPLFSELKFVEILPINPHGAGIQMLDVLKTAWKLKSEKQKILLDLHAVIRTHILDFFLRFTGHKIFKIDKGRSGKKEMIALKPKKLEPLKSNFERYIDVFRKAGFSFPLDHSAVLDKITIDKSHERWIGIAPFAKYESKMLDLNRMKRIVSELLELEAVRIFIFGNGKKENELALKYFSGMDNVEICIDKFDLEKELEIISNLDLMISMDSGNGHIAANYQVPVITLWGVTHPSLGFSPFLQPSDNSIIPSLEIYPYLPVSVYGKCSDDHYLRAIDSIEIDKVVLRAKKLLDFD